MSEEEKVRTREEQVREYFSPNRDCLDITLDDFEYTLDEAEARGAAEAVLKMTFATERQAIEDQKAGKRGEAFWRLCLINALTDPEGWDNEEAQSHIDLLISEFKEVGAEEQRRKDAEEVIHQWRPTKGMPWHDCTKKQQETEASLGYETRTLYTHPANVAALEVKTERRFQHTERGTEYRLIGRGKLQQNGPYDMAEVVIYQDVNDGSFWVRSPSEFYDGRFKEVFGDRAALTREGGE